jgi:O-acetyl-ADP-ribose deacetylase (regulator of RNase III)
VRLHIRDRNAALVEALRREFAGVANVEVTCGDIFDVPADAIVSPANSFGFMDGGIDLAYTKRFGWDLQERLQELLRKEHAGELPVGQAVIVETYASDIPWLVSAPTMRVPGDVSQTVNAYLALRAALLAVQRHELEPRIEAVLAPGFCTAVGRMPPERAARQMAMAWAVVVLGQTPSPRMLGQAVESHAWLLR